MKSVLDLLDLPFSFWQLRPLTEQQFRTEAKERGVYLPAQQMEALHRLRLLVPIFRVARDGRAIAALARRGDPFIWEAAHWQPTTRVDLINARDSGRLHDPRQEHFVARRRLRRQIGEFTYDASEYLYSHHQLLALPVVRAALPHITFAPDGQADGYGDLYPAFSGHWRSRADRLYPRLVAISALEPLYHPEIMRNVRYNGDELEEYEDWRRGLRPRALLDWLEVDAAWLMDSARHLLEEASGFDPLGGWSTLLGDADPDSWEKLRDQARSAVDLRIGAEILLRYYERLANGRMAPSIRPPGPRERDPLADRLRPRGRLDSTLAQFGLSPHPRLVLVVEGETEMLILPRVMAHFRVSLDREFISIENARGVGRDLSALVAYAVAPPTEREESGRYLRPLRPLTRFLVVADAEGKYATETDRERRRQVWIEGILTTLPTVDRTAAVRDAVERLVAVATWDRKGQSFEFANFTDRQLALASAKVDPRTKLSEKKRVAMAAGIRASRGSIAPLLGGASKIALAETLWPVLEAKMRLAQKRGTQLNIPVVAVVDRAVTLAHELPRKNVVIPLQPDP
jgi:hypothetical protein